MELYYCYCYRCYAMRNGCLCINATQQNTMGYSKHTSSSDEGLRK